MLSFQESYSSTTENAGTATVNVRRTGGATGPASVNVRLGTGGGYVSAGQGCDFTVVFMFLKGLEGVKNPLMEGSKIHR